MQFFFVDKDNNLVEYVSSNIKYYSFDKTKKKEKIARKINSIDSWITSQAENFEFEINNKSFFWLHNVKSHVMCHTKEQKKVKIVRNEKDSSTENETEVEVVTIEVSNSEKEKN